MVRLGYGEIGLRRPGACAAARNHVRQAALAVAVLVAAHVLLVRKHGIVPPFALSEAPEGPASVPDSHPVPPPAPTLAPGPALGNEVVPNASPKELVP